ncbi:hypothetical protein LQV05_005658 [Cryptococcus neoformans]|nr:hypothetical protein LQV05_005658 [Cryptococcus neoformans]
MSQTFLSGFHSLPPDIQQKVYDLDVVLDRENVVKFFYPILQDEEDEEKTPAVDWDDDPPERWSRKERQQVFQLNRSDPPPGCIASFRPAARKLLLLNEISSITFVDEEAVYQTERAALLYYKMNGYASLKAIASCGGYVQEVLFLRADHIVFGADVAKHMVGYGPGWAEKVRNLSYAFRGPTWVRLEIQEDVMEEEQAGEAAEGANKVELLTRPSSNKPDGQIHSVPSKFFEAPASTQMTQPPRYLAQLYKSHLPACLCTCPSFCNDAPRLAGMESWVHK